MQGHGVVTRPSPEEHVHWQVHPISLDCGLLRFVACLQQNGFIFFLGMLYWSHLLSQCFLIVTSCWITDGKKQIFRNLSVQFKPQYQTQITWTGQKSATAWWMMVASTISGALTTLILHNITRTTLCKDNVWLNRHATNSSVCANFRNFNFEFYFSCSKPLLCRFILATCTLPEPTFDTEPYYLNSPQTSPCIYNW